MVAEKRKWSWRGAGFILLVLLNPSSSSAAGEVANTFILDGTLYSSPTGTTTLLDGAVLVRVQILNPAKTCVLYDEQQTVNTTASDGAFTIQVGSLPGAGKRVGGSDAGNTMGQVFQNAAAITATGCAGSSYTPAAADIRYVRMIATPSSTGVADTLSPDMSLGSVPSALVADTLQGVARTGFLQLGAVTQLTQANFNTVFSDTNYPILSSLLTGGGSSGSGSSTGSYIINADSGSSGTGAINFNVAGSTKASIANNGNFSVDTNTLFVDAGNNRVGIGSATPSFDFSLGGDAARVIAMERQSAAAAAGNALTLGAGGAKSGGTDLNGGDLYLASGTATGAGSSNIFLQTSTAGASASADRAPTTKMTILGSGNVGIGTTNPGQRLSVAGNISLTGDIVASGAIRSVSGFTTSSDYFAGISFPNASGSNTADITFSTSNTRRVTITKDGNVGIGTTSPSEKLSVTGNATVSGNVIADAIFASNVPVYRSASSSGGTTNYWVRIVRVQMNAQYQSFQGKISLSSRYAGNADINFLVRQDVALAGAPVVNVQVDSMNALLGLGNVVAVTTTNSAAATVVDLFVKTEMDYDILGYQVVNSAGWYQSFDATPGSFVAALPAGTQTAAAYGSSLWSAYAGTNIGYGGRVGIGTTSPSEKLHVVGNLRVQGSTDCTLGNGAGGTSCSSDIRLKNNVRSLADSLARIGRLRGVEFDWNEKSLAPGRHDMGVIAQEVEKVFPTAVREDQGGYKRVDYAVLVAPLIQAVKELAGKGRWLAGEVTGLNARLRALESARAEQNLEIARLRGMAEKSRADAAALRAYLCAENRGASVCR